MSGAGGRERVGRRVALVVTLEIEYAAMAASPEEAVALAKAELLQDLDALREQCTVVATDEGPLDAEAHGHARSQLGDSVDTRSWALPMPLLDSIAESEAEDEEAERQAAREAAGREGAGQG